MNDEEKNMVVMKHSIFEFNNINDLIKQWPKIRDV